MTSDKILLHICCAPCLIFPLQRLAERGLEVQGVFYNPNIHGLAEYSARKQSLQAFSEKRGAGGLPVDFPDYDPAQFFSEIKPSAVKQRCVSCWEMRMRFTARLAKLKGIGLFSTTLLVSPFQDHELLRAAGERAAAEEGARFYYEDFRPGFNQARAEARAAGLYMQKYCGCIYSEVERYSADKHSGVKKNAGIR